MPVVFSPTLPDRRQLIRNLVVDVTELIATWTTPDETELREHLITAAASLIAAAATAGPPVPMPLDPAWQTALPPQKDPPEVKPLS